MKEPIKGKEYLCIKTVVMSSGYTAYIKGKVYISEQNGCITNEQNNADHIWTKEGINECFTKIKETFEITKETIIKYKMKDEFPEVFALDFIGKWINFKNAIYFIEEIDYSKSEDDLHNIVKSYGFNINGAWSDTCFRSKTVIDKGIEATEQEVFEALKNEAVKRYNKGVWIEDIYNGKTKEDIIQVSSVTFDYEKIGAGINQGEMALRDSDGSIIFQNGKWATIIPTKTKEEAEKLLGVKIID